jgi:hypothetical protein
VLTPEAIAEGGSDLALIRPAGKATLYIYLSKTEDEGDQQSAAINLPISNLLKVEMEFAGAPTTE